MEAKFRTFSQKLGSALLALLFLVWTAQASAGYAFNQIVPDVRQPVGLSGGSACPVRAHQLTVASSIALRWSTALSTNPVSILTQNQTATARLAEIEQVITQSLAAWTSVQGTTLLPASITPPARVATQLCQILDADIYFDPNNSQITFATPAALPASRNSYDLQSVLTHELGHFLGFSHSAVWSAMMYPYAPAPGTFNGTRPTQLQPGAPLGDDDRTGLRILYPDPADVANVGIISGRILPANPLSLPLSPPGVTGIFGAHVVAVDQSSGAVIAATIAGWSCASLGPAQFDGTYQLDHLPINHSYTVYAEPLDGVVSPAQISPAMATLCRNPTTDAGWPPLQACVVPAANTSFTTRFR
jgi:hypothetical protein